MLHTDNVEAGDNSIANPEVDTLISVALTARIEMLEAENQRLQKSINASNDKPCL